MREHLPFVLGRDCLTRSDCALDVVQLRRAAQRAPLSVIERPIDIVMGQQALVRCRHVPLAEAFPAESWEHARALVGPTLGAMHAVCPAAALVAATQLMLAVRRDMHCIITLQQHAARAPERARELFETPLYAVLAALGMRMLLESSLRTFGVLSQSPYALGGGADVDVDAPYASTSSLRIVFAAAQGLLFARAAPRLRYVRVAEGVMIGSLLAATLLVLERDFRAPRAYATQYFVACLHALTPLFFMQMSLSRWHELLHARRTQAERDVAALRRTSADCAEQLTSTTAHDTDDDALRCIEAWANAAPPGQRGLENIVLAYQTGDYAPLGEALMPLAAPILPPLREIAPCPCSRHTRAAHSGAAD